MSNQELIEKSYQIAKEEFNTLGIDTDAVLERMEKVIISLHCWQADDVVGFEFPDSSLAAGGIQATGNYPGKATSLDQLRADLDKVISLLPGKQRLNLHALYGDFNNEFIDRDQIEISHFQSWIDWAKERGMGLDFNASCFSHPKAADGFTLSHKNEMIRKFWVEHVKRCRAIASAIGKQLGTPCVHNIWIPDGTKDIPIDRYGHREILIKSLDEIFSVDYPGEHLKDALESKVFGIGLESMTVGSHEFYLSYALKNNKMICLDNGHFHPTESVGDKISSCLLFVNEILLHLTRPIRWDSDHVVVLNEDIQLIAFEIIRNNLLSKVSIGLDFFDASINRIGAYVTGARATQKAFMIAMLEPTAKLKTYEESGKNFERLAMLEELKTKPYGSVWDYYCLKQNIPVGIDYIAEVQHYEKSVLSKR